MAYLRDCDEAYMYPSGFVEEILKHEEHDAIMTSTLDTKLVTNGKEVHRTVIDRIDDCVDTNDWQFGYAEYERLLEVFESGDGVLFDHLLETPSTRVVTKEILDVELDAIMTSPLDTKLIINDKEAHRTAIDRIDDCVDTNDWQFGYVEYERILQAFESGDGVLFDHLLETPSRRVVTKEILDAELEAISTHNLWRRCADAGCV